MKVLIFYRPNSEHARAVDEFMHEFSRRYPDASLEVLDVDTIIGSQEAEVYDVMQYPTVIARSDAGVTLQRWDNGLMPLMNEVAYFANQ
jgi:hypothetical protein